MSKFGRYIMSPKSNIDEKTYEGNIGFEEMVNFYRTASSKDINLMEKIIKEEDWLGFKNLIRRVIGVSLE